MYYYGNYYGRIGREGNGGSYSPNQFRPERTETERESRRNDWGSKVIINGIEYTVGRAR